MLLRSYAFTPSQIDPSICYDIIEEVEKHKGLLYKYWKMRAEEAKFETIYHAVTHFDPSKGSLSAYIKRVIRDILKDGGGKAVSSDFLDTAAVEDSDNESGTSIEVNQSRLPDFATDVVDKITYVEDKSNLVAQLALEFMDRFIILCEKLKMCDVNDKYYPDVFKHRCLELLDRMPNFVPLCLRLYDAYSSKMRWYLDEGLYYLPQTNRWREAEFNTIDSKTYKAGKLVTDTGEEVFDADMQKCHFVGKLPTGMRILRVYYYDIWDYMCNLVDDDSINVMKFMIGDDYVIRTFAGSQSILNVDPNTEYDVIRSELLTNVIYDSWSQVLHVGSECFYLVSNKNKPINNTTRHIHDLDICFNYEDITAAVIK